MKKLRIIIVLFVVILTLAQLQGVPLVVGNEDEVGSEDFDEFLKTYSVSFYKCPAEGYILTNKELLKYGWTKIEDTFKPTQIEIHPIYNYACYESGKLIKGNRVYRYLFIVFDNTEKAREEYNSWKNAILSRINDGDDIYFEIISPRTLDDEQNITYASEGFKYYYKDLFGFPEGDTYSVILSYNAIVYVFGNEEWLDWGDATDDAALVIAARATIVEWLKAYIKYTRMKISKLEQEYPGVNLEEAKSNIDNVELLLNNTSEIDILDKWNELHHTIIESYLNALTIVETYKLLVRKYIEPAEKLYQNITKTAKLLEQNGVVVSLVYTELNTSKLYLDKAKELLKEGNYTEAGRYINFTMQTLLNAALVLNSTLNQWEEARDQLNQLKTEYKELESKFSRLAQEGVIIPKNITTAFENTKNQIEELDNKFENGEYKTVAIDALQLRSSLHDITSKVDYVYKLFELSKKRIHEAEEYLNTTREKYTGIVLIDAEKKLDEAKENFIHGEYEKAKNNANKVFDIVDITKNEYLKAKEALQKVETDFKTLQELYEAYDSRNSDSQEIKDKYLRCQQNLEAIREMFKAGSYNKVISIAPSVNQCIQELRDRIEAEMAKETAKETTKESREPTEIAKTAQSEGICGPATIVGLALLFALVIRKRTF